MKEEKKELPNDLVYRSRPRFETCQEKARSMMRSNSMLAEVLFQAASEAFVAIAFVFGTDILR